MDCDLLQMHNTIRIPRLQLIALNNLIGNVHLPSFHHLNQEEIDSRYLFLILPELSLLFLTAGGVVGWEDQLTAVWTIKIMRQQTKVISLKDNCFYITLFP